jgi:bifunctional non-homologous end joining protein LigD
MVFDLLADGDTIVTAEPWSTRRTRLEQRLASRQTTHVRLADTVPNQGRALLRHARTNGWEGIIAKRMNAPYVLGDRSPAWQKLKVEFRQEFVVGGYTDPRRSRPLFGALLLGYFEGNALIYVGHAGGGFTRQSLKTMYARLTRIPRKTSPFQTEPKTNERAHWVRPEIVVEVKFSEWTSDGRLRQPIFLGVRDDKNARDVHLEATSVQRNTKQVSARAHSTHGAARGMYSKPHTRRMARVGPRGRTTATRR